MGIQFNFDLDGKRGLAVLVTCDYEDTPGIPTLKSTQRDAAEMRQTFEQFEYDIVSLANREATGSVIAELVNQLSEYMKEYTGPIYNADGGIKAIVFYFAGHGMDDNRIRANDMEIPLLEDIMEPLARYSHEIPKLFLIDVARGNLRPGNPRDKDSHHFINVSHHFINVYIELATTQGYEGNTTWSTVVARMLREHDNTYHYVMSTIRHSAFQEHWMQQSEMISWLTVEFKLYYCKSEQ